MVSRGVTNHKYCLFHGLLGYIWLLGTIVNSSCDIKKNIKIDQNCCSNLEVRELNYSPAIGMNVFDGISDIYVLNWYRSVSIRISK